MEQALSRLMKNRNSFAGDVLKLVSGTAFAQALSFLAAPVIARLYAPEAFGLSTIFISITNIITVISCLRYEMAIVLPEADEEAANLLGVSIGIATLISFLMVPVIWLAGPWIQYLFNAPELGPYLWLVPPIIFFGGVSLGHPGLNYWNSRSRRFGRLSLIHIVNSIVTIGAQLGLGYAGFATGGSLIGSMAVGSIISTTVLVWLVWRDDNTLFRRSIKWQQMLAGIKRYRKFPLYDAWAILLNNVSWQLPAFLLSAFFSPVVVGYYALGNRVLRVPMNLIGNALAQVFFQRAAEAKGSGTLAIVVESVFRRLVAFGMFPMLLMTIIGSDVFIVIFGKNWAEAGVYTQILSIWMFFWFISSPLSTLFRVLEKQEFSLGLNIVIFSTRFLALGIGGWLGSARLAISLFALSGVVLYGYLSLAIVVDAGVPRLNVIRIMLSKFVAFAPAGAILLTFKFLGISREINVGVGIILLGIYLLYLFRSDQQLWNLLKQVRKMD